MMMKYVEHQGVTWREDGYDFLRVTSGVKIRCTPSLKLGLSALCTVCVRVQGKGSCTLCFSGYIINNEITVVFAVIR